MVFSFVAARRKAAEGKRRIKTEEEELAGMFTYTMHTRMISLLDHSVAQPTEYTVLFKFSYVKSIHFWNNVVHVLLVDSKHGTSADVSLIGLVKVPCFDQLKIMQTLLWKLNFGDFWLNLLKVNQKSVFWDQITKYQSKSTLCSKWGLTNALSTLMSVGEFAASWLRE